MSDWPESSEAEFHHFASLLNLFHELLSSLDLGKVLPQIAASAADFLNLPYVALWLREGEFLEMRAEYSKWIEGQNETRKLKLGEGVAGRAAVAGKPLYIEDVRDDPRWVNADWARRNKLASCLSIPLTGKSGSIGALSCMSYGVRHFSGQEVYLATTFANSAALAVENARTYSELQARQEMLVRAERLTTLGTMASGLAHEILNPANIIGLHAQRLAMGEAGREVLAESAEVIQRNVNRIADICQHFRQYSRVEKTQAQPLDPHALIRETLPLVQHDCRVNGIKIEANFAGGVFLVLGAWSALQQVFVNLFSNARDAMPSGGRLTISTTALAGGGGRGWWEARVADTGPGIPPEAMGRMFEAFFTTKPKEKGTGLGLFISRGIVEQHGGVLRSESAPGQGATFIVQLPLVEREAAAKD